MMPGDIPCLAECRAARCCWCEFGLCTDNATCEWRIRIAEDEDDEEGGEE